MGKTNFSDAVRHLYIPLLNTISTTPDNGIRYWLANSSNYLILPTTGSDMFELNFYDSKEVLSSWANDINRLSCASLETVCNTNAETYNKKFLGWKLINYYYSAFFSAHSITKILGFGIVQIDNIIINFLQRKGAAYGVPVPPISSGLYCVNFDIASNKAIFYKVKRYNDSHKGLWNRFSDLLGVLSGVLTVTGTYDSNCIIKREQSVPYPLSIYAHLPQDDASTIVEIIDNLRNFMNTKGDFNWLSTVRNIINYSHGFGVWFPYKTYQRQYDKISTLAGLNHENPALSQFGKTFEPDLINFVRGCQLINSINLEILNDLLSRHPDNKSFLKNGYHSFLKLYKNYAN